MNHNCIIVYESIYNGNTEKIAKEMALTLGCSYIKSHEALKTDLSQFKTIGFGSGIYFGSHHAAIMEVVTKLDRSEQEVFIFSTRGAPVLGKYHLPIKQSNIPLFPLTTPSTALLMKVRTNIPITLKPIF